jgi:hypothetical protein
MLPVPMVLIKVKHALCEKLGGTVGAPAMRSFLKKSTSSNLIA